MGGHKRGAGRAEHSWWPLNPENPGSGYEDSLGRGGRSSSGARKRPAALLGWGFHPPPWVLVLTPGRLLSRCSASARVAGGIKQTVQYEWRCPVL